MINISNPTPTLPVSDLNRAREFYEKKLGLTPTEPNDEYVQHYKSGNGEIEVYKSELAGTNKATSLTWEVKNIDEEVQSLKEKGISFEHYDLPESKLEGDIHVIKGLKAAWFKDPDENILCIHS